VNATVVNPSFSSQTKEKLITEVKDFGYQFEITDKLIKLILKSEIVNSILDWIQRKKEADESKLARNLNKNLSKLKVDKLIDAKGKDRLKCSIGIFEGDCLEENTKIRVIRNGGILDVKIKDVNIDDLVITHNNSFSNVYSLTKRIKKKSIIKLSNSGDLVCGINHRWFVYDTQNNEFYFENTGSIDKNKHKMVKNYLAFLEALLIITDINGDKILLESGEIINTNYDHQFAVYDKQENKFKMMKIEEMNKDIHLLVNVYKL
jgi:hypothetical protein